MSSRHMQFSSLAAGGQPRPLWRTPACTVHGGLQICVAHLISQLAHWYLLNMIWSPQEANRSAIKCTIYLSFGGTQQIGWIHLSYSQRGWHLSLSSSGYDTVTPNWVSVSHLFFPPSCTVHVSLCVLQWGCVGCMFPSLLDDCRCVNCSGVPLIFLCETPRAPQVNVFSIILLW